MAHRTRFGRAGAARTRSARCATRASCATLAAVATLATTACTPGEPSSSAPPTPSASAPSALTPSPDPSTIAIGTWWNADELAFIAEATAFYRATFDQLIAGMQRRYADPEHVAALVAVHTAKAREDLLEEIRLAREDDLTLIGTPRLTHTAVRSLVASPVVSAIVLEVCVDWSPTGSGRAVEPLTVTIMRSADGALRIRAIQGADDVPCPARGDPLRPGTPQE
ncbi:hypothetical protein [Serinibacter salmoneus]|uniref:Mce-associated membrane protein n=1 Tax=Serinibacter salmoneus TaxID=556530 RepID=A0A2A9D0E1_9MICO|nr:hypothetical protein [Serinibacter salmoneus]PFG20113.1 hypothetical protein ATL40_1698 [Serinibacter salmoneus]